MRRWLSDTDGAKSKYSEKTFLQCHFASHKSHMHLPGTELEPPRLEAGDKPPELWHSLRIGMEDRGGAWTACVRKRQVLWGGRLLGGTESAPEPACGFLLNRDVEHLIPWTRVLLEKLMVAQQVTKFPTFYKVRKFITVFSVACHDFLTSAILIHLCSHYKSSRSILVLSSRLWTDFTRSLFQRVPL